MRQERGYYARTHTRATIDGELAREFMPDFVRRKTKTDHLPGEKGEREHGKPREGKKSQSLFRFLSLFFRFTRVLRGKETEEAEREDIVTESIESEDF